MKNVTLFSAVMILLASCHKSDYDCPGCGGGYNHYQNGNTTTTITTIVNDTVVGNDTTNTGGSGTQTTGANIVLSSMMPGAGMQDGDTLWILTSDPGVRMADGTMNPNGVACNPIWAVVSTSSGFMQYRSLGTNYYQWKGTMATIPAQATGVKNMIFDYMRPGTSNFIGLIISN